MPATSVDIDQERLHRSCAGRIGGVCAGIAETIGVDTDLVRTASVVLCVLTFGIAGLVYLALWAILPVQGSRSAAARVDANASVITSEVYGQVADTPCAEHSSSLDMPVLVALVVGVLVLVAGMGIVLSRITTNFEPVQFWPMAIMAAGIMRMVLPDRQGRRAWPFVAGAVILALGVVALTDSLGFTDMHWIPWITHGFPLLVLAAGCFIAGRKMNNDQVAPWLFVASAVSVAAFLIYGLVAFLNPGQVEQVIVVLLGDRLVLPLS